MSRVAKYPVLLPKGVEVLIERGVLSVKGRNGSLSMAVHSDVQVEHADGMLSVVARSAAATARAMAGTTRALMNNMVVSVG